MNYPNRSRLLCSIELYGEMIRDQFVEKFEWKPGSIALGQSRYWHFAQNDYHGHRREMHRITIEGSPFVAISQDELGSSPA